MPESPIASLPEHFSTLEDPRADGGKRHLLLDILVIAISSVICGADSWVEVEPFAQTKQDWLATFLELPHGVPSHDTFGRVFERLDPDQFHSSYLSWITAIQTITQGQIIALDGKTLRRSHDRTLGKSAIQLASAWAAANHLVLGQAKVAEKSNEIKAIPGLLDAFSFDAFNLTTVTDFFGVMFSYFVLLMSISAAMWGSGITSKEERDKTVEFALTLPVPRWRVVTAKILAAFVNCIALLLITWGRIAAQCGALRTG